MRAEGTFEVVSFVPAEIGAADPAVTTGLPVSVATMRKTYNGQVDGRSTTIFTAAFDPTTGTGTYVAMDSFEGSLDGHRGTFNFVHSASTSGSERSHEFFLIVAASGTGDLSGLTGSGGLAVDADGVHRVWFDYDLAPSA